MSEHCFSSEHDKQYTRQQGSGSGEIADIFYLLIE